MRYLVAALLHPREHEWWSLRPWARHSLVLAVSGSIYMLVGVSYLIAGANPAREQALALALSWWSLDVWGAIWVLVGGVAVLSARWPPASETWGYTLMTGLSAAWASFYLFGVLLFGAPLQGLSSVLVWALIAFVWWAISGLVNPDKEA